MSHEPPLPEAARSPYPLHPAPMAAHDPDAAPPSEQAAAEGQAAAPESATPGWADRARETFELATTSKAALGAAVGIGSAALLAALLFARRGRKQRA